MTFKELASSFLNFNFCERANASLPYLNDWTVSDVCSNDKLKSILTLFVSFCESLRAEISESILDCWL